jgi:excinuclease ABC subunit C
LNISGYDSELNPANINMVSNLKKKVKDLPKVPGVYKFNDKNGKVIYIGKAKNLFNRVGSYFSVNFDPSSKTYSLINKIDDIDYIEAHSEFEALILEAELIKKFRPKYNISLKDDKSFIYIVIRDEIFVIENKRRKIPKVLTARKTDIREKDAVFGPYPDGTTAKQIVRLIRKIFPYRDCSTTKFNKYKKLKKNCLFGHIGLCNGPCSSVEDEAFKEYRKNISRIKKLLSGESVQIVRNIERSMYKFSKIQEFEKAGKYRDLLDKFNYVRQEYTDPEDYIKNPYLVQDLYEKALLDLREELPILNSIPKRIECYDISNLSGKDAVGSMVVSLNGRMENSEYRKFKIKFKKTPDDFDMMKEVINRRARREVSKNKSIIRWGIPDLIVVDGGKGQVTAALEALEEAGIELPVIGIAKKNESLVYRFKGKFVEKILPKENKGLLLIIKLRDEAHRFAQRYHHHLRLKKISGKK